MILHVDSFLGTCTYALPGKETFRHMVSYRDRDELIGRKNSLEETFECSAIPYVGVYWFASIPAQLENSDRATIYTSPLPVAKTIVYDNVRQLEPT